MPRLDSARHERFAQGLAEGRTAISAYTAAGYLPNRSAASRLSTNVNILTRVNELRGELGEKEKLDRAWVITRLMRNAEKENGAVSNRALELLGRTMGMFNEVEPATPALPERSASTSNLTPVDFLAAARKYG